MKRLLAENKSFFGLFAALQLLGLICMLRFSREDLFLFIYRNRSPYLNNLFLYLTDLGDGLFFVVLIVVLCFIRFRLAFIALLSFLLTSIITHTMKGLVFAEQVRPKKFFEGIHEILAVPGGKLFNNNSFPSGHTVTAFAVFTLIALFIRHKQWGWLFCLLAVFIGLSRVYLAQHFFVDIYVGSWIGTLCSLLFYYLFMMRSSFLDRTKWADSCLLNLIRNGQL
jgi:membrane-associated phospholipid phosphatase